MVEVKYSVYILESRKTGKYYVGQTNDLQFRIDQHNSGKNKSTKHGVPWVLVHHEKFNTRSEAFAREQQIKRYKGGEAFKKLLA